MKEVTCPHCEQVFEMDAAGYADIAKQIKDSEFKKELESKLEDAKQKFNYEIETSRKQSLKKNEKEFRKKIKKSKN